jgi:hypothetical protein
VASSSGRRVNASERDDMARDAAPQSKPDREVHGHVGEKSAGLVFDNSNRSNIEPEDSIRRNV